MPARLGVEGAAGESPYPPKYSLSERSLFIRAVILIRLFGLLTDHCLHLQRRRLNNVSGDPAPTADDNLLATQQELNAVRATERRAGASRL